MNLFPANHRTEQYDLKYCACAGMLAPTHLLTVKMKQKAFKFYHLNSGKGCICTHSKKKKDEIDISIQLVAEAQHQ